MDRFDEVFELLRSSKFLENSTTQNGTQLIGKVAHVGPEAYLHMIFRQLPIDSLGAIEREIGRKLPSPLEELYSACNGLILFSGTLALYGLRTSYVRTGAEPWQPFDIAVPNTSERVPGATSDMVFFGSYDWDGSLLYISPKSSTVYRCSRKSTAPLTSWPNVLEMLRSEIRRISALFDETGTQLDENRQTTPS